MKYRRLLCMILVFWVAACQNSDNIPQPTLMVMASPTPSVTHEVFLTQTPTTTLTVAASNSPTFSPTPTITLSDTPIATPTGTPSNTPTPRPVEVRVESEVGGYVRSGPGIEYEIVGTVTYEQQLELLAYRLDTFGDQWYLVMLPSGNTAWISQWVAVLREVELAQVATAVTLPPTLTTTPTLTPSITPTFPPGANGYVSGADGVNLRSGASRSARIRIVLPPGTPLVINGRNPDATWLQVASFGSGTGWVLAELITSFVDIFSLPMTWIEPPTSTPRPASSSGSLSDIFRAGQRLGNQANVFVKVGDSITANQPFLDGFGTRQYSLGNYGNLQAAISFFTSRSFTDSSIAAQNAFTSAAVLDPIWATSPLCVPNESPLICEYRVKKPSIAIILLGSQDMRIYDVNTFRLYYTQVIDTTISMGIIPVLTTFPTRSDFFPEQADQFNDVIRQIARQRQLPLIELRDRAAALPDNGTQADGFHLSDGGHPFDFNGEENLWGVNLRNLLTLQVLETLRQNILSG